MNLLMTKTKTYKQRTYLDPIHGPIELNLSDATDLLLAKIIDTKEFQRLRRIRQMGLGCFTFHGAEHTRFGHSLGTLFIAKKMINRLSNKFPEINLFKAEIFVCALVHDIGHGPFSHTSEKFTHLTHEDLTKEIVSGNTEINNLTKAYDEDLPKRILQIFECETSPFYLSQIISSYIDCDRLDYLLRDSYYVGVPYGITGSERIIASLEIDEKTNKLVVSETVGLDAVIHYLHARYSMYQQVYQHKKNLACDFLLKKIITRAKEIKPKNTSNALNCWLNFENKLVRKIDLENYLQVDDILLISNIENWGIDPTSEKILKDLANRFIHRKLFKSLEFRQETTEDEVKEILEKLMQTAKSKGLDPQYYIGIEESASKPYEPYKATTSKTSKAIYIKQQNGLIKELSQISGLVKALSQENIVKTCIIFTPELENEINDLKGFEKLFK